MSSEHALRERAELLDELHDIVQAMKNVAFAELQRVNRTLPALAEARAALTQALACLPSAEAAPSRARAPTGSSTATAWLVIGAERGFCGAFNAHLCAAVAQLRRDDPHAAVLVASHRLLGLMGDRAVGALPLPGCSAVDDSADALEAWLDAVAPFTSRRAGELWLLHQGAGGMQRLRLWPPGDDGEAASASRRPGAAERALPAARSRHLPLHHLPWPALREALQRQALRLLLQAALHESLAQENHWRLTQMQLAQDHLDELGRALRRKRSVQRQAEITNELETLVSALPSRSARAHKALP